MRRKYLHQVSVHRNIPFMDEYGGNTLYETDLGSSWAKVETLSANRLNSVGLDINKQTVRITMRYRDDIDYTQEGLFFKYKTLSWQPVSVINKDVFNREIEVIAVNIKIDNMAEITYVPFSAGGGVKLIDGYTVKKAAGNTAETIEVGDFLYGELNGEWVAGFVTAIPVSTSADLNLADQGTT